MRPSESAVFGSVVLILLIAVAAMVFTRFPTMSVGDTTVPTSAIVGLFSGLLLLPSIVSHYKSGETREWMRWALFAVGIPLSLTQRSPVNWIGVLAIFVSIAIAWEIDQRLFGIASR